MKANTRKEVQTADNSQGLIFVATCGKTGFFRHACKVSTDAGCRQTIVLRQNNSKVIDLDTLVERLSLE